MNWSLTAGMRRELPRQLRPHLPPSWAELREWVGIQATADELDVVSSARYRPNGPLRPRWNARTYPSQDDMLPSPPPDDKFCHYLARGFHGIF